MAPSGAENETERTSLSWSLNAATSAWLATSHSRTVGLPFPPAEASIAPSGENDVVLTRSVCPTRVAACSPVSTSHSLIVPSSEEETIVAPLGEKAAAVTPELCLSVPTRVPVAASMSSTVPPMDPAARIPRPENATDQTLPAAGSSARAREEFASYSHTPMLLATPHSGHPPKAPRPGHFARERPSPDAPSPPGADARSGSPRPVLPPPCPRPLL